MRKIHQHAKYLIQSQEVNAMFNRNDEADRMQERLPEMRPPRDPIAEAGKRLRDRLDALRPQTELKHWR